MLPQKLTERSVENGGEQAEQGWTLGGHSEVHVGIHGNLSQHLAPDLAGTRQDVQLQGGRGGPWGIVLDT